MRRRHAREQRLSVPNTNQAPTLTRLHLWCDPGRFVMLLLLYSFFAIPLRLAFEVRKGEDGVVTDECNGDISNQAVMFYVDFAIDCLFFVDVCVNFRTAYVISDVTLFRGGEGGDDFDQVETGWKEIAARYMRSFFILDICACFPYDIVLLTVCASTAQGAEKIIRAPLFFKLIRMSRALRFLKVCARSANSPPPPPPPRTNRTRRVLHPVLIGHAASHTPPPHPRRGEQHGALHAPAMACSHRTTLAPRRARGECPDALSRCRLVPA